MSASVLRNQCAEILSQALATEIGLVVRTNDTERAKLAFYKFRKELGETEFRRIQIKFSPTNPDEELWLTTATEPDEPKPEPSFETSDNIEL